jgi:hypothetical protein
MDKPISRAKAHRTFRISLSSGSAAKLEQIDSQPRVMTI